MVTQAPTGPEREVTSVKSKAQGGGDQGLPATAEELKAWQHSDPTLEKARSLVSEQPAEGERIYFYLQDKLLYRHWQPEGLAALAMGCEQLVLPKECQVVLCLSHDVPVAGHLGITIPRITSSNTTIGLESSRRWPGIVNPVRSVRRASLDDPLEQRWWQCLWRHSPFIELPWTSWALCHVRRGPTIHSGL